MLKITSLFVTSSLFSANPAWEREWSGSYGAEYKFKAFTGHAEGDDRLVIVKIVGIAKIGKYAVGDAEGESVESFPYSGIFQMVADLTFEQLESNGAPATSEESQQNIDSAVLSGGSIVYSAIREHVANLTARSVHGVAHLEPKYIGQSHILQPDEDFSF